MGDKIDILKITLDFLKGNKVLLLIVTSVLTSSTAGFFSGVEYSKPTEVVKSEKVTCNCNDEISRLKREIAILRRWH